jgi:tight adherence protein B
MVGLLAAALAGYGALLCYTALALGWRGLGPGPLPHRPRRRLSLRAWLDQAGMEGVRPAELAAACVAAMVVGAAFAYLIFGGVLPAVLAGAFCAALPVASARARRARRRQAALQAWPRILEELRLLTGSLGRSIPQALFEAGRHAPEELRPAFAAAEREWLLTTDFSATLAVLRDRLADSTADVVAETLEIAHEIGGGDLDQRLADLVEDRVLDLQGRKDAETKQAGVRFARRFVLAVPLGMAVAGLAIGTGRSAYQTAGGQVAVAAGIVALVACWVWSGRLLRLPAEPRVLAKSDQAQR